MKRQAALVLILLSVMNLASCSKVKEMDERTEEMNKNTGEMNQTTKKMSDTTSDMSETTEGMSVTTVEMKQITEGMSKTTEGMSITTKEMKEITQGMSDTTQGMSKTTNEMRDTTTHMYTQIRTKESEDTRSKKMKVIQNESGMGEKIAAAAVFYKSFEYQMWTANGTYDVNSIREDLFLDAVNEFYKRMSDLYNEADLEDMSPLNQDEEYNSDMAFYAMSVALHENIHHQVESKKHAKVDFEVASFLDLMDGAFTKEVEGREDELKEYEHVILAGENRDISIKMLQARFNMILALVAKDTATQEEMSAMDKIKGFGFKVTGGAIGSLKLKSTFESSNISTKKDLLKKLDGATWTADLLQKIGVEVKFDESLKSVFDNLKLQENKSVSPEDQEYVDYINQLRSM